MATFITYAGITWTFSTDRPTGYRANGEPWVQGPVTVTSISPGSSAINTDVLTGYVQNGAMKNPVPEAENGFTNGLQLHAIGTGINYNSALNVALALPLSLVAGDMLVSCITDPDLNLYGGGGEYRNDFPLWNTMINVYAALEVLATPPPEPGFRGGLFGTSRKTFHVSDIDWSIFPNLPRVASSPSLAEIQALLPALPMIEWNGASSTGPFLGSQNVASGAFENGVSTYGRDIANKWSKVAQYLCLEPLEGDEAAWEALVIQVIQVGLDYHSYFENGGTMQANGAQKVGRSFPHTLAAHALGDSAMIAAVTSSPYLFPEKGQTIFMVAQSDVGRSVEGDRVTYGPEHVGKAEWGQVHWYAPQNDDSRLNAEYRTANWPQMAGTILATRLLGIDFGWVPSLLYTERFKDEISAYSGFTGAMWAAYYPGLPSLKPAPPVFSRAPGAVPFIIEQGDTVALSTATAGATIYYNFNGVETDTEYTVPFPASNGTLNVAVFHPDFLAPTHSSASYTVTTLPAPPSGGRGSPI